MNDLAELSITEASRKLTTKEISALDLARACLRNIDAKNASLNAYLEVFDDVEAQAKAADERRAKGESNPLLGIPLAMKDNILIAGHRASAASKMLQNYTAVYDATIAKKLKAAGAVFLGRTNMDEFALGGSTMNSAFGVTKNPHDEARVAGGTSGGSAAAVAAHMALGALGTDTGGSVRNPASYCGIVGLKPTYGAVSRSGLIAAVSSFDQAGPMTKTVADAQLMFDATRGKDPLDSTTIDERTSIADEKVMTIGVIPMGVEAEKENTEAVNATMQLLAEKIKELQSYGLQVKTVEIPSLTQALAAYYIINFAEVSTNLARFDGVRYGLSVQGDSLLEDYMRSRSEGFGPETRRRIMLGTYVLSAGYYDAFYGKAVEVRTKLLKEYTHAFESVDVIVTPTMPTPAFRIGEKADPLSLYLEDIFTVPANLTGLPAISVPMGAVARDGKDLPVGIQFMAARGAERKLFNVGKLLLEESVQ